LLLLEAQVALQLYSVTAIFTSQLTEE